MKIRTHTGSERGASCERKGYIFLVEAGRNRKEIHLYRRYEPEDSKWEDIGYRGKHGKWVTCEYELPADTVLKVFGMESQGSFNEVSVVYIILDAQEPLRCLAGSGSEGRCVWIEGCFYHIPKEELSQFGIEVERKYLKYIDKNIEIKKIAPEEERV